LVEPFVSNYAAAQVMLVRRLKTGSIMGVLIADICQASPSTVCINTVSLVASASYIFCYAIAPMHFESVAPRAAKNFQTVVSLSDTNSA